MAAIRSESVWSANHYSGKYARFYSSDNIYPHYVAKVEKKGRSKEKLHDVIEWLTGFKESDLHQHIDSKATFRQFFAKATINPNASQITGTICGYRIEEIETPLTRQVRYLDKLVDELAKGRKMGKTLRS